MGGPLFIGNKTWCVMRIKVETVISSYIDGCVTPVDIFVFLANVKTYIYIYIINNQTILLNNNCLYSIFGSTVNPCGVEAGILWDNYTITFTVHPSPKVMADFFRHKNYYDALIQFVRFLVGAWDACRWSFPARNILTLCINPFCTGCLNAVSVFSNQV